MSNHSSVLFFLAKFAFTCQKLLQTIEIKPAVVEAPVARPQNIPATIQQEAVLQQVPVGSGSNAIVATYPVLKKIRVIDPYDPSATESESEPSTPQLSLKLLESVSKVQDTKDLSSVKPPSDLSL
ncbi:hypothetical protein PAXRUDRAFT_825038 [Paxillus rubicundulus Ve08.2h10]|uniref:Uncharacterized protein n=1 Tax=Paxillus rubicundulus Ve08.2h10 TaxID=930991 RepID=A0A0D0E707_9AGAM|nr:hypothetical protein PAXRUDRAFT_825038 [Paxillus rubicundulus Ve08.2h10]